MGMEEEALDLAHQILRRPTINAPLFAAAVETLLIMASRLKRQRKSVETAYARLKMKDQRAVRHWMLAFYHSAAEYRLARCFIPKSFNRPNSVFELVWAWDIWSALDDEKSLAKHFSGLVTAASRSEHPLIKGMLLTSIGDYCMRTEQWHLASEFYGLIPTESSNLQQAILGPLLARFGEFLQALKTATKTLDRFKCHHDADLETILPGNLRMQHREIQKQLNTLDRGMKRLLGKKGLKQIERDDRL